MTSKAVALESTPAPEVVSTAPQYVVSQDLRQEAWADARISLEQVEHPEVRSWCRHRTSPRRKEPRPSGRQG